MTKKLKTLFQYAFFLGLGIFFIWWSLKSLTNADKLQIAAALGKASFGYILPALSMLLFSHWLRAMRWRLIIQPMGYTPSTLNTFFAVMVGYLANQAVPRLGEVLRCSTLTKYEKIPLDKLLGSVILERTIDTVCLLGVFAIVLVTQPDLYKNILTTFFGSPNSANNNKLLLYALLGVLLAGLGIVTVVIMSRRKSGKLWGRLRNIMLHIWQGFTAIRALKKPGSFIFLSVLIWVLYAASVYMGFLMLQETHYLGIKEALTVLSAGSLAMVATPGGIGAYAFLVQKTMELYHLNSGVGLALGWLLWCPQVAVVLIAGGLSLLALPVYNKTKGRATAPNE